ncbi:MAG: sulfite exporter TauE/SafE family protein [Xanthobacteraceae bacterium]
MDGFVLVLFLLAAFAGGFASGLAGFAMGFVVSGVWLHLISPIQTTALIVGYGLWTQGYGVWRLRHTLNWRNLAPFIAAGAVGVPVGTLLLTYVDGAYLRTGVGVLLVVYGIYGLMQPAMQPVRAGVVADGGIGLLNGLLCGLTGLPGFIITVWCGLRGWTKDVQRAVFQPVMLAAMVMTAVSLGISGAVTIETAKLYVLGLPAMLGGLWVGFKLYGKLDEVAFRKLILVLLLFSGLALIVAQVWPSARASGGAP